LSDDDAVSAALLRSRSIGPMMRCRNGNFVKDFDHGNDLDTGYPQHCCMLSRRWIVGGLQA
jgi:hypothetical protein